jgi:polysaccharide export outer membrane protein
MAHARLRWALVLVATVGCFEPDHSLIPPAEPPEITSGFQLGDSFEVRVYGEDEIGGAFQVQEDGSIVFSLLGRVEVEGLTQAQLAAELERRLADGYLREPQVTVVLTARQNYEVSVLGQVQKPGSFPYIERLTIVQAISDAGGLTDIAHKRRVKLTRQTGEGPKTFEVSIKAITEGREADIMLQPGDIVFVPEAPF